MHNRITMLRFPVVFLGVVSLATAIPIQGGGMGANQNKGIPRVPYMPVNNGAAGNMMVAMDNMDAGTAVPSGLRTYGALGGLGNGGAVDSMAENGGFAGVSMQTMPALPMMSKGAFNMITNPVIDGNSGRIGPLNNEGAVMNTGNGNAELQAAITNAAAAMENARRNAAMSASMTNTAINNANSVNHIVMNNAAAVMENAARDAAMNNAMVSSAVSNAQRNINNANNINNNAMNAVFMNAEARSSANMNAASTMSAAANDAFMNALTSNANMVTEASMGAAVNNANMNAFAVNNFMNNAYAAGLNMQGDMANIYMNNANAAGLNMQGDTANAMANVATSYGGNDVSGMGTLVMSDVAGNVNAMNAGNTFGMNAGGMDQAVAMGNIFPNNQAANNIAVGNNNNANAGGYGPVMMVPLISDTVNAGTSGPLAAIGNMNSGAGMASLIPDNAMAGSSGILAAMGGLSAGAGNAPQGGDGGLRGFPAIGPDCYVDQSGNVVRLPAMGGAGQDVTAAVSATGGAY